MKPLNQNQANQAQTSWLRLRQEEVNNCFEHYHEIEKQYDRITGTDFGQVQSELLDELENWDDNSSLSFCMGVDKATGLFSPYFELNPDEPGKKPQYFRAERNLTKTYITPVNNKYHTHVGVSVDYKNEVCANWALIPYYMVSRIFFQTISLDGFGQGLLVDAEKQLLQRPKRVKKFIIQKEDINAMRGTLNAGSSIKMNYGVNYGHSANQQIAFTPVIEISQTNSLSDDDDDTTYLDFVHACPPTCPD